MPQAWKMNLDVFGPAGLNIFLNPNVLTKKIMFFIPHAWKLNLDVGGPAGLEIVQNLNVFDQKDNVVISQAWKLFKILLFLTKKMMFFIPQA